MLVYDHQFSFCVRLFLHEATGATLLLLLDLLLLIYLKGIEF